MKSEFQYCGMSIQEGVKYIESHYSESLIQNVRQFSELHDFSDANTALPFPEDVGNGQWLSFVNTVIDAFDQKRAIV